MLLLWQIDAKSSGASPPLHRVNNDEGTANEGLSVCMFVYVCLMVPSNVPHVFKSTCVRIHTSVEGGMVNPEEVIILHHLVLCIYFLAFV